MSPKLLIFLFISGIVTAPSSSKAVTTPQSAYDILSSYNFPIGLLPIGSTGYEFNPTTGDFAVYFDGECKFSLEGSYQLKYQSKISGRISENNLSNLKGVSVKVLLFWVNIIDVLRVKENIEFSVGIASADFPVENFSECPKCGCGIDCVDGKERVFESREAI